MNEKFRYGTTSEAVTKLRALGFDKDFTLKDGFVWWGFEKFKAEDLKIAFLQKLHLAKLDKYNSNAGTDEK